MSHRAGRFFEGQDHTDGSVFLLDRTAELLNDRGADVAAFDVDQNALEFAVLVRERDHPIDALVRTLLLDAANRLCINETKCPPLELVSAIRAGLGELTRSFDLRWLVDYLD